MKRVTMASAMMVLWMSLAACDVDFLGPDSEGSIVSSSRTGHWVVRGVVTSAVDGSPIEGAEVYAASHASIILPGPLLETTIVETDAAGRYLLDTEYYCGSQLAAKAAGYVTVTAGLATLSCHGTPSNLLVDIRLSVNAG